MASAVDQGWYSLDLTEILSYARLWKLDGVGGVRLVRRSNTRCVTISPVTDKEEHYVDQCRPF
jgi:hypothetical protein